MAQLRAAPPPPSVHIELFVTPRSQRAKVRRISRALYRAVRPRTRRRGGSGPHLFLLEPRPRKRDWPANLRAALGAKPDEDLWIELAFYSSAKNRRSTLRELWAIPDVARLAGGVESITRKRPRAWTLALGRLQAV